MRTIFGPRRALIPAFLLSLTALSSCATVPITGRKQLLLLPASEEQKMGLSSYEEILKKEKLSTDVAQIAMLQKVGERIAAATGEQLAWEFKLIDNPTTVNAFCLPGGKVAVYTGILPLTQDEAGLAAVLGHEIAHAIARHGGERVSQQMVAKLGLAAVSTGMANKDPKTVETVTALLGAGATVGVLLPFSRSQESEADHLGLIYMAKAGYDPNQAIAFWGRMAEKSGGGKTPEWLSTHPSDAKRIEQLKKELPEAMQYYKK
ncbi:MAG: M48 family metallopeptidase [Polyangia bacterium]